MINKKDIELISVIIPCFNEGILLKRSLNSAINQTWDNIEIVLVDDGSSKEITLEIIDRYRDSPLVNILKQSNNGLPNARNSGVKYARGDYLFSKLNT